MNKSESTEDKKHAPIITHRLCLLLPTPMRWSRTSVAAFAEKALDPRASLILILPYLPAPFQILKIQLTMSEEDTKPGAPAAEVVAEKAEHIEDAGSAVEKKLEAIEKKLEIPIKKAPGSALQLLSNADKTILRINKYVPTRTRSQST